MNHRAEELYRGVMTMEAAWRLYQQFPDRVGEESTVREIVEKLHAWSSDEVFRMTHAAICINEQSDVILILLLAELQRRGHGDIIQAFRS